MVSRGWPDDSPGRLRGEGPQGDRLRMQHRTGGRVHPQYANRGGLHQALHGSCRATWTGRAPIGRHPRSSPCDEISVPDLHGGRWRLLGTRGTGRSRCRYPRSIYIRIRRDGVHGADIDAQEHRVQASPSTKPGSGSGRSRPWFGVPGESGASRSSRSQQLVRTFNSGPAEFSVK